MRKSIVSGEEEFIFRQSNWAVHLKAQRWKGNLLQRRADEKQFFAPPIHISSSFKVNKSFTYGRRRSR